MNTGLDPRIVDHMHGRASLAIGIVVPGGTPQWWRCKSRAIVAV